MKKSYTKKQITEAIVYWKKQLKMMNESDDTFDLHKAVADAVNQCKWTISRPARQMIFDGVDKILDDKRYTDRYDAIADFLACANVFCDKYTYEIDDENLYGIITDLVNDGKHALANMYAAIKNGDFEEYDDENEYDALLACSHISNVILKYVKDESISTDVKPFYEKYLNP